jgi:hypothetical protein
MGRTDCKTTVAKTPTVAIKTTNGKPTTNQQTVRVNVQTRKLLKTTQEWIFPKPSLDDSSIRFSPAITTT